MARRPTSLTCSRTAVVWVAPMGFEITTFLMSIYKTWRHARLNGDLNSNPLMRVLFRDGLVYFVVRPCLVRPPYLHINALSHPGYHVCVSTIATALFGRWLTPNLHLTGMRVSNLICWLTFPVSLMFVGVFILWALVIVMINRLFLNLRGLHNSEKTDWGFEGHHSTKAVGDPRRTHAPAPFPNRAQSTNIFRGGTILGGEELTIINHQRSIGFVGIQATRTEERRRRSLDNQSPISVAPTPDKKHTHVHFLPHDTPLTNEAQSSVSPQTALGCDKQLPLQGHGSGFRVLIPGRNSDNWDETEPSEEGSPRRAGLGSYGP